MHTPPEAMLADYASGAISPGIALLVASHIDGVAPSRGSVARYERVGGALLADEPEADMGADALDAVLGRIDALESRRDPPAPARASLDAGPLPRCLIEAVGSDFGAIPWRFRLPGVSEYRLPGFENETVSLLRARPGSSVPQHTHEGEEVTLVLTGEMEDGGEIYRAGDVAINDESDDHKPRIVGTEVCHCLIVMTGSLRFTGRLTRALNLFAE